MGCKEKSAAPASEPRVEKKPVWTDLRTWTASDGRTLDGALIARIGEDGVVKRAVDGALLRLPPRFLDPQNLDYLKNAFASGTVPTTLPDVWYVRTKLTIPSGEAWMAPDTVGSLGPRIAKSEPLYWLLLSELDGSGSKWVRVDNGSYSKIQSDILLPHAQLATQVNGSGAFIDQVGCPRNDLYIIDARYGLINRRINVTRAMMRHLADGRLPVTVSPELFDMPGHAPDVWELMITWQRPKGGAVTRVLRDGSILAWPES